MRELYLENQAEDIVWGVDVYGTKHSIPDRNSILGVESFPPHEREGQVSFIITGRDDGDISKEDRQQGGWGRGTKLLPSLSVLFSSLWLVTSGRCEKYEKSKS